MLSLPLLPPQQDSTATLRHPYRPRPDSPPPHTTAQQQPHRPPPNRHDTNRNSHSTPTPLALLLADENAIAHRKHSIQDFGSHWLRPPGIPKTLQAMREEDAERLEMEEAARRERGLADLQARQQVLEVREQAEEGGEGEEERDLDAEVPEAEEGGSFNGESVLEGSSVFLPSGVGGVGENEGEAEGERDLDAEVEDEGGVAGRYALEMEEAELTGAARDEEALGIVHEERDLDEEVPEAGAYEHTDTEEEEDDDEDTEFDSEVHDSFAGVAARSSARVSGGSVEAGLWRGSMPGGVASLGSLPGGASVGMGALQERMRAQVGVSEGLSRSPGSVDLGSSTLESSFVGSSPVLQRGANGRRGRGRGRGS